MTGTASTEWRLIDEVDTNRDPAEHMDADLNLLDGVANGLAPALRLYTWTMPTLSLGRFQPGTDVDTAACDRLGVRVVRRPTGGAALLHGADLTYCVVMPLPDGREGAVQHVYERIAGALIVGLRAVGVDAAIARNDGPPGPVCFAGQQGADLRVGDRKVCGSAQVRQRGVVLQHGSILLRRLEIDESDVTIAACHRDELRNATVTLEELGASTDPHDVAAALVAGFEQSLGLAFAPATLAAQGNTNIIGISTSASVSL
ncbi:MAG: lipoate--protein ligase family protein [Acidimicrobiia bacterium]|nr:lipoate--protein ligase family protein [Acidimicrobiia bacterium]